MYDNKWYDANNQWQNGMILCNIGENMQNIVTQYMSPWHRVILPETPRYSFIYFYHSIAEDPSFVNHFKSGELTNVLKKHGFKNYQ